MQEVGVKRKEGDTKKNPSKRPISGRKNQEKRAEGPRNPRGQSQPVNLATGGSENKKKGKGDPGYLSYQKCAKEGQEFRRGKGLRRERCDHHKKWGTFQKKNTTG